jgi:hypothetical protein
MKNEGILLSIDKYWVWREDLHVVMNLDIESGKV